MNASHARDSWIASLAARFLRSRSSSAVLARGASGTLLIRITSAALAFGVQVLIARLLGADSYGAYVYAITWQTFLLIFGISGFETASLRFVAEYAGSKQWSLLRGFLRYSQRTTLRVASAIAIAAGAIVYAIRDRLDTEVAAALLLAFLILPPNVLLQIRSYSLQGFKHVIRAQLPRDIIRPLIFVGGLALAVALGFPNTAPVAVVANLVAVLCVLGAATWLLRRTVPPAAREAPPEYRRSEWLTAARVLLLVSGLNLVHARVDVLMVGTLIGTRDAGIYSVASQIAAFVSFGLSSVNVIVAPLIAEMYARKNMVELQRVLRLAARGALLFAIPCTAAMILGGRYALILFGTEFAAGHFVLAILAVGGLANTLGGSVGFLMTMTGHQAIAARILLGSAVGNVVLNAAFIYLWGAIGAAIATAIATVTWNAAMNYYAWKHLRLRATVV